jgi:hypothetical protein
LIWSSNGVFDETVTLRSFFRPMYLEAVYGDLAVYADFAEAI